MLQLVYAQLPSRLPGFLAGAQRIFCDLSAIGRGGHLAAALNAGDVADKAISPLRPLMHRLRYVTSKSFTCSKKSHSHR